MCSRNFLWRWCAVVCGVSAALITTSAEAVTLSRTVPNAGHPYTVSIDYTVTSATTFDVTTSSTLLPPGTPGAQSVYPTYFRNSVSHVTYNLTLDFLIGDMSQTGPKSAVGNVSTLPPGTYEFYNNTPSNFGGTTADDIFGTIVWDGVSLSSPVSSKIVYNWRVISTTGDNVTLTLNANGVAIDTKAVAGFSDSLSGGTTWSGTKDAANGAIISVTAGAGYRVSTGPTAFLPHTVATPPSPENLGSTDLIIFVDKPAAQRRQVSLRVVIRNSVGTVGASVVANVANASLTNQPLLTVTSTTAATTSGVWTGDMEDGASFNLTLPSGAVVLIGPSGAVSATNTNFYYLVELPVVVGGTATPSTALGWDKDGDGAQDTVQITSPSGTQTFIQTPDLQSPVTTRPSSGNSVPNTSAGFPSITGGSDNQLLSAILAEVSAAHKDAKEKKGAFDDAPTVVAPADSTIPRTDTTAVSSAMQGMNPFPSFTLGTALPPQISWSFDLPYYGTWAMSFNFADQPIATWCGWLRAFLLLLVTLGACVTTIKLISKGVSSI